jgi:hypothetical protein
MSTKRKEYKVDARARKAEQNWGVEWLAELRGWRRRVMIANRDATALSAFAFAMTVALYPPYPPYPPPAALKEIATGGGAAGGGGGGSQFTIHPWGTGVGGFFVTKRQTNDLRFGRSAHEHGRAL